MNTQLQINSERKLLMQGMFLHIEKWAHERWLHLKELDHPASMSNLQYDKWYWACVGALDDLYRIKLK